MDRADPMEEFPMPTWGEKTIRRWGALLLVAAAIAGCAPVDDDAGERPPASPDVSAAVTLGGTSWRLVEFQSMDDAVGKILPEEPSAFTMILGEDGSVRMQLDCNRATGRWSAEPSSQADSGRFEFGPLATTRALCAPPNLDERIARDAEYVRSYLLRDGRLHLSLMADAGIYTWERIEGDVSAP